MAIGVQTGYCSPVGWGEERTPTSAPFSNPELSLDSLAIVLGFALLTANLL
jgi:hypothetical protein